MCVRRRNWQERKTAEMITVRVRDQQGGDRAGIDIGAALSTEPDVRGTVEPAKVVRVHEGS